MTDTQSHLALYERSLYVTWGCPRFKLLVYSDNMSPMKVIVVVHLEPVEDTDSGFTWWGESPQIPGFSIGDEVLPELARRARVAVPEILDRSDVDIDFQLASDDEPQPAGPEFAPTGDLSVAKNGPDGLVQQVSKTKTLVSH